MYYHLSKKFLGSEPILKPKVPLSSCESFEGNIPRVCFSKRVEKCIRSITNCHPLKIKHLSEFKKFSIPSANFLPTCKTICQLEQELNELKNKCKIIKISKRNIRKITPELIRYYSLKQELENLYLLNIEKNQVITEQLLKLKIDKIQIINPSIYVPIISKEIYLPPAWGDFRSNEEHWALKSIKVKFVGYLDLLQYTENKLRLTNEEVSLTNDYFEANYNKRIYITKFKSQRIKID